MPYFSVLLAAFVLSSGLRLYGQQSIVQRCEAARSLPRAEDNQPIPEQLKIPNAPKTAREVSCFVSLNKKSAMAVMNDCSTVSISTPDLQRLVMKHMKQGKSTVLLSN